jgi:hypothetical protein
MPRSPEPAIDPSYPSFHGQRIVPVPAGRRVHVVGESRHQVELEAIVGGKTYDGAHLRVTALLVPETDNSADPRAIAAYIEGKHVGYLSHDDVIAYHVLGDQLRERSLAARCRAQIRGGWSRPGGDEGAFGVVLDLAPPHRFEDPDLYDGGEDAG